MTISFMRRGVPLGLMQDAWWLDGPVFSSAEAGGGNGPGAPLAGRAKGNAYEGAVLFALLIASADMLIWIDWPGLSLAVFGLIVLLSACAMAGGRGVGGVVLGALLFLPVVEQVQALSLMFWLLGLLLGAGWIGLGGWSGIGGTVTAALRFAVSVPGQSVQDLRGAFVAGPRVEQAGLRRFALGWALPLGLGLIFAALLLEANPMLAHLLGGFDGVELPDASRVLFWLGIGFVLWPFLRLVRMQQRLRLPFGRVQRGPVAVPAILNAGSVRRSLILFNALFAVQTLSDLTYLWGGAALPEGMSYAEYAHRGAYPLLVAALLAGGFALIARPFVVQDKLLRAVLLAWVAQTVLLVLSSILRLELYVEVYGLTRLRIAAFIWMGLVAAGLCLVLWQIIKGRSAAWLLLRAAGLGAVTLYACCFVSFDRQIVRYNLSHPVPFDHAYICRLGDGATPALLAHKVRTGQRLCYGRGGYVYNPQDWREWGFRNMRIRHSLARIKTGGRQDG